MTTLNSSFLSWFNQQFDTLPKRAIETSTRAAFAALERALNHLLRGESWARQALLPHAGKLVKLQTTPALFELNLRVTEQGLFQVVSPAASNEVSSANDEFTQTDLTLTVALRDLPSLARQSTQAVRVAGDAELATVVNQLVRHLRWDVADDLSRVVGDIAAHRLVNTARSAAQQLRTSTTNLVSSGADYLSEEAQLLTSQPAFESFSAQVRELRDDVERFLKRIEKQEARLNPTRAAK